MQKPSRWEDKLHRSGFLIGAVLLHLAAFVCVATWVIIPATAPAHQQTFQLQAAPVAEEKPKAPSNDVDAALAGLASASSSYDGAFPIQGPGLQMPRIISSQGVGEIHFAGSAAAQSNTGAGEGQVSGISKKRLADVRNGLLKHVTIRDIGLGQPASEFPVYVAKYARGDWACNLRLDKDGNIIAGSMPDLMAKIGEWSHGKIRGTVSPKPLNIAGRELLDQMPPFIFMTGHRDFIFTGEEVANLRDYLQAGGAIWADNALAGYGSPFDVAFRREMKRVVPDHALEPLAMSSEVFAAGPYRFDAVPSGINYRAEPLEHLDIDGVMRCSTPRTITATSTRCASSPATNRSRPVASTRADPTRCSPPTGCSTAIARSTSATSNYIPPSPCTGLA